MSTADGPRGSLVAVALRSSAANFALPLSSLITGPLIARALDPDGRGAMAALLAPISLANLAFTLGAPEALTYHVATRRLSRRRVMQAAVVSAVLCGALAIAVLAVAAPWLLRQYPELQGPFYAMLLTLPFTLGFAVVRGAAQGLRQFDLVNVERTVGTIVRLVAICGAVAVGVLTAVSAAWITILSGLGASLILLRGFWSNRYPQSDTARAADVSRYAANSAFGTAGAFLVLRLDQVLMAPLAGPAELGFYAVAVSLAELPIVAVAALRDIVFTVAADSDDRRVPTRISRISTLLMIPVCAVACLAAPIAIPLLFGADFEPAVAMTAILLLGMVPMTATAILGAGLMSVGRAGVRSAIQIGGAVLTAGLLVLLVPSLGGIGAAIASFVTYAALALATAIAYSRASGESLRYCTVPTRADLVEIRVAARRLRKSSS